MQHINFYRQLERAVEPVFSAKQQAYCLLAALAVMLMIFATLTWQQSHQLDHLAPLQQEQQQNAQVVEQLRLQKQQLENDSQLAQEVGSLMAAVDFRRQLLTTINPETKQSSQGFALHLNGLAQQQLKGLWFSEILLREGGKQMALTGFARKPELLPQYLQKLMFEPIFNGLEFSVLKIEQAENMPSAVRFKVSTVQKLATPEAFNHD